MTTVQGLNFECYQLPNGVWVKERTDGRRGYCVADEAVLWQALRAAEDRAGPGADVAALVAENERLHRENDVLRANQRRRPGRPRKPLAAGAQTEALAAPEQDPLDEDL